MPFITFHKLSWTRIFVMKTSQYFVVVIILIRYWLTAVIYFCYVLLSILFPFLHLHRQQLKFLCVYINGVAVKYFWCVMIFTTWICNTIYSPLLKSNIDSQVFLILLRHQKSSNNNLFWSVTKYLIALYSICDNGEEACDKGSYFKEITMEPNPSYLIIERL